MGKKQRAVFAVMLVIVNLLLLIICFGNRKHDTRMKDIFINKLYFLLIDGEREIANYDGDYESFNRLQEHLVRLDTLCEIYKWETKGQFSYGTPPGCFGSLGSYIEENLLDTGDMQMLQENLKEILRLLSDESGINPNTDLTYSQVDDILSPFLTKWNTLS